MLFPFFVLGLLFTPAIWPYIPEVLKQNYWLPVMLLLVVPFIIIRYKKELFWKITEISIDKSLGEISIDGKSYLLKDLEYYELHNGSIMTSGDGREVIFLKFRNRKKVIIMPCRTSGNIADYDSFFPDFLKTCDEVFSENKERGYSKAFKYSLIAILIVVNFLFIYFLIDRGKAAFRMVPGLLGAYAVFLPIIFKPKRKGRNYFERA